jgi:hypothetical protein
MNLKMNLIYLSALAGMVMFSNRAVYAQKGSASIFQADATTNILKRSAQDISQGDLCLRLTTNQISYKSRLETRDEKSEFIAMNRKYYRRDAEINKASPVLLNTSFIYHSLPKDSTNRAEITQFYLNKSKHQQTAAWVLLGVGSTMTLVGFIGLNSLTTSSTDKGWSRVDKLFSSFGFLFIGVVTDLVSIPFFISASHNKNKAAALSFSNQIIYSPLDKSYSQNVVPSLTLRIKL